jgi:CRP-like cAMP-binding protein
MSQEQIAQLQADPQFRGLPRDELERLANLAERLRIAPVFSRLSLADLAYIAQAGTIETYERGEVLIEEGATDRVVYVILKGQLRVWQWNEKGKRQLLGYHFPGDFSGELIMTTGKPRTATIDVVVESELVAFGEEGWARICEQGLYHRIAAEGRNRFRENQRPFPGKRLNEVNIQRARKSRVVLLRGILVPVLLAIVGLVLIGIFLYEHAPEAATISVGVILIILFGWIVWAWYDWRNDDYIVTSQRVIFIERVMIPPFPIERREVPIRAIQEIETVEQGLWTYLFGVKSLEIRTMGVGAIPFPDLDNADQVRERILAAKQSQLDRSVIPERMLIRQELEKELLGKEGKQVVTLPSDPEEETRDSAKFGWGPLDYLIPHTRIEESNGITWRQHWLYMLYAVTAPVLVGIGLLVLIAWLLLDPSDWLDGWRWIVALVGFLLLVADFGWYLWQYEGWRNHVYKVTNNRIIDIEGTPFGLMGEKRVDGLFEVIQNVTYDSPNWFLRALSIGDVSIDTPGQKAAYTFDRVSHPDEVQQEIFKRVSVYRERAAEYTAQRRRQDFLEWIREYDRLVRPGGIS